METFLVYYQVLILVGLLLSLASVLVNVASFGSLRPAPPPPADEAPLVSILVPARNEARSIEACVASLLSQDYPRCEWIVLDDSSEDGTGDIVRRLGLGESGERRVIRGETLPIGWTGKGWACHQLSLAARGEYLFFTDADTTHAPGTVSAAVGAMRENRVSLLSAWPRLITKTWGEKLVIPMILLLGLIIYPHWLVLLLQRFPSVSTLLPESVRRLLGAANGQFIFFTRAAYERVGGHAAIRDHLVEDVALGRAVAQRMGEGMRLLNCEALQFSTCRMYQSFGEVWEGFTKNIRAAFENSLFGYLFTGATQVCGFLLPFAFVFVPGPARPLVVAQIGIIYLIRVVLTLRFRTSWLGCLFHPIGEFLALLIGFNSWRRLATKGVTWKGRTYQS